MPALLLLLHRRRVGPDLICACRPGARSVCSSIAMGIAGWPANSPPPSRFTPADNAFLRIDDWERAQALADTLSPDHLHRILDHYAQQCCPVLDVPAQSYHWSFMQVEYATDLVFRTPAILKPLYEQLSRQAILTVKAEHVATFLGHKITAQLAQKIQPVHHAYRGHLRQASFQ